jgi:hypothetical protein
VWVHRALPGAAGFNQPAVTFDRSIPLTVAGFARYFHSPVGPYGEVWGSPALVVHAGRVSLSIAFMAVDSEASLRGGRENWALPKVMARFGPAWRAMGPGWEVRAQVLSRGLPIPIWLSGHLLQATDTGDLLRARATVRGFARPARVRVDVDGADTPRWLLPGRHVGVAVERATMTVHAPRSLEGR